MGSAFNDIIKNAKKTFVQVRIYKPKASKKESRESYIICKNMI